MKQKDAVYAAVVSVLADAGITFEDGMNVGEFIEQDKTLRAKIQTIMVTGFKNGDVSFEDTPSNREKMSTPAKLNQYVSGLTSNWLRKDKRLNGDVKYEAKNPGTRVGSTDPQLKALRLLAIQFKNDPIKFKELQTHITNRVGSLQAEKAKSIKIDLSVLDPALLAELGLAADVSTDA